MIDISRNLFVRNILNATKVCFMDRFVVSQYSNFLGGKEWGMRRSVGHTSIIDLTQSEEELLSSFKSNTRNEVRRAIREGFFFERVDSVDEFVSFYNDFAQEKNLERISAYKISRFSDKVIMFKSGLNGVTLTMHASTLDKDLKLVSLLYSASIRFNENIERKNVGFSGRFLHYMEFLEFKKMGYTQYNFSGVCIDPEQKERYSIGLFKRGFGGDETDSYMLQSYPLMFINLIREFIGSMRKENSENNSALNEKEGSCVVDNDAIKNIEGGVIVLLTCHKRREKTRCCLSSLKEAINHYNEVYERELSVTIFLNDDGSSDDTAEAARSVFPDPNVLHLLQGNGELYWAGGMRYCWNEAIKWHDTQDYFLLLNDDVELFRTLFCELFSVEYYSLKRYGHDALVSGITCSKVDHSKMTYGGDVWTNRLLGTTRRLGSTGVTQLCDITNANILLVPIPVVERIGVFDDGYIHSHADNDYSVMATRAGFPVLLTANFCGACENNHRDSIEEKKNVINMSLRERKAYYKNPIHLTRDYLHLVKRITPIRLPIVWVGRMLNLFCPRLYYRINGLR